MNVAVTGATGFVGRHVVGELERRGIKPTLVCRSAGELSGDGSRHKVVEMELRSPPKDPFAVLGKPDILIHLAWGGLPNYQSRQHCDEELPVQRTFLSAMIAGGLRNLLVTGTCLEYGMQSGQLREDHEAKPSNPYGSAKNALRLELESLRAKAPFNLTWARLFYLYGEGQAPGSLFSQLRRAVARGDSSFDMSGGEQLRDYLPVTEAAAYLVSLAMLKRDIGCVNVCSGRPVSVRALVERWIRENGWSIDLNLGRYPYPDYEPMEFWGDRKKLSWCLETQ